MYRKCGWLQTLSSQSRKCFQGGLLFLPGLGDTIYGSLNMNSIIARRRLAVMVPILAVPLVIKIPVPVVIPLVVMFKSTAVSLPVTLKKRPTIVTRGDPVSPRIRWSSPITFMPPVTVFQHIPIPVYPHKLGSRLRWRHVNHSRWWRRTNCDSNGDSNGDLSAKYRHASE